MTRVTSDIISQAEMAAYRPNEFSPAKVTRFGQEFISELVLKINLMALMIK